MSTPAERAAAELEAQGLPLVAPLVGNESKYAVVANAVRQSLRRAAKTQQVKPGESA